MEIYVAPRREVGGSEAVYSLLARLFFEKYGGELPAIEKTKNGKPFFPDLPGVHFSLSHARTHVLCALSGHPIGADIESPRPVSDKAIRYFCLPGELNLFEPLDLWVLKESYIKLIGGTLVDAKKIRFSREGDKVSASDKNVIIKLYRIGECHAAVSSLGESPPDTVLQINDLRV